MRRSLLESPAFPGTHPTGSIQGLLYRQTPCESLQLWDTKSKGSSDQESQEPSRYSSSQLNLSSWKPTMVMAQLPGWELFLVPSTCFCHIPAP